MIPRLKFVLKKSRFLTHSSEKVDTVQQKNITLISSPRPIIVIDQ